jgi:ribosomal protein S18 acetylase RimI-like enzyme
MIKDGEGNIAGFIIALPSLSKALQKANGKIFPFGFYHIRKALKNPTGCDLLLTGVHPDWQGKGMVSLLFSELLQELIGSGVQHLETTGMLETNHKAIQNWKNFDHIQHKRKRCYRKNLA